MVFHRGKSAGLRTADLSAVKKRYHVNRGIHWGISQGGIFLEPD